jgi:glycosyltransferase involved in cell wall biosynthesis
MWIFGRWTWRGAEELVLPGARSTLDNSRPIVIFEVNPEVSRRLGLSGAGAWATLKKPGYGFCALNGVGALRGLRCRPTGRECDPFVRFTGRKATLGLATTKKTAKRMRKLGCRQVSVHSEAGLPKEEMWHLSSIPLRHNSVFRVLSLGRLVHWKGFELGLRAFANIQNQCPTSEYWFVGEGPEEERLRSLARDLGVSGKVTFFGRLSRSQALEKLTQCDVLVHPSLHDSGGWVCLEAMAAGRPVICLDLGGPDLQVTNETGFKIAATLPEQAVRGLAQALSSLAADYGLRSRLGMGGRQRVMDHFDWDGKGEYRAKIYEGLVREHGPSVH